MALSMYCHVALMSQATAEERDAQIRKEPTQDGDGIVLAVHDEANKILAATADHPFETIRASIPESSLPVMLQTESICEDVEPAGTGFDAHGEDGFKKHASCEDLSQYCHNSTVGEQVRVSCPVSCFICTPSDVSQHHQDGPCFDAVHTGIRFRDGPKAACRDLIKYCNHTSIGKEVRDACKLSCGVCELNSGGPYADAYGNCEDLPTDEEPQFSISGALAGCPDMAQFCQNHPDSQLIRHKCPLTCGMCGSKKETTIDAESTDKASTTPEPDDVEYPGDISDHITGDHVGCDRRRRWGFCSTRRRRNV